MTLRQRAASGLRRLAGRLDDRRQPDGPTRDDLHTALDALDEVVTAYMLGDTDGAAVARVQQSARTMLARARHPSAASTGDELLAAMYADPAHPLRAAADRRRATLRPVRDREEQP